jgi:nucleoside-diphosphate-sugar epimerase
MKILVTGASGLLGHEICKQLKDADNEVWAIDNHSRSSIVPPCDQFLSIDLMNVEDIATLPTDFDQIYHYAAINGTKNFYERPNEVLVNNFVSDVNMFYYAKTCTKLQKIVYASSSEIVSDDPVSPTPENTDIFIKDIHNARWSYRLAKITSENFLFNSTLPFVICRYFNIYGEDSKAGHFIADQMTKIENGVFEITGATETRSFCYVTDGVAATIYCANNVTGEVVNIGNDTEVSIPNAANTIAKSMGIEDARWNIKPSLAGSTPTRRPNISKLRSIMKDYSPRTFAEGMVKIVANRSSNS